MGDREEFLQIWQQHVTRPGSEKLLDWLDHKTDIQRFLEKLELCLVYPA